MEVRTAVASATLSSGGVGWQAEKAHRPAHEDLRQRWVVEPLGLVLHDPEERGAQRMDDHQREELRIAPAMDLGVGPQMHRGESDRAGEALSQLGGLLGPGQDLHDASVTMRRRVTGEAPTERAATRSISSMSSARRRSMNAAISACLSGKYW